MRYVEVSGVRLSVIGLGTWQFGSREWGYGAHYAQEESRQILARAVDLGINLIDTAEMYAFGRSERIVGKGIAERRSDVFIATKIFPLLPVSAVVEQRAKASRSRLGVDAIDLYQVHWPNPVVPMRTTMDGLGHLLDSGIVHHVGVSNFSLAQWQQAESLLGRPVLSNQVRFNLLDRRPEAELVGWAQSHDRLIIAYSPLAQGLLSGRYDVDHRPSGLRSMTPEFLPENLRRVGPLLSVLREVAEAHGATLSQVALAWVVSHPNVVAIPGASSVAQLEANAAAGDIELGEDEIAALSAASDHYIPVRGLSATAGLARMMAERAGLDRLIGSRSGHS